MCVHCDAATRTTEDGEDEEHGSDTTVGCVRKSERHTKSSEAQTRSTHTRKTMAGITLSIDEYYKTSKSLNIYP